MVLGSDDPHLISICNNQNARKELVNWLTYSHNCSEFERIRQEKKMLQQILVLAKLIGQERPSVCLESLGLDRQESGGAGLPGENDELLDFFGMGIKHYAKS